ncbi:MAG: alpha/beta hydrolase fold domain-containing protein [Planctomycetes bacterium]|nr:alpha/beta hydrolase fold domain-containing protein [Planctomycetota bacterium]
MRTILALAALTLLFATPGCVPAAGRHKDVSPPENQPLVGPGSSEYPHATVRVEGHGEGNERYWLCEPSGPIPNSAPVVVFLHGYGALDTKPYEGWLRHLARRGNIVIYPKFQDTLFEPPENYASNAAAAIKAALALLESGEDYHVMPRREEFAIVGHSAGGMTCANLAARFAEFGLPTPRVAMPIQPGGNGPGTRDPIPAADYSKIPGDCLLLAVFGDSDGVVGSYCAEKIFVEAGARDENKNLVEFRSDNYGDEVLVADHFTPTAGKDDADFFDWYGYWKLFDGLCDAAFRGINRQYALGDTPEQRFMGRFDDGHMVNELRVTLGGAQVTPNEDFKPIYDAWGKPYRKGGPLRDLIANRLRHGD